MDPERQAARVIAFGSTKALKTITAEQAWREFGLSARDISALPFSVVFDSSSETRLFNKFEVGHFFVYFEKLSEIK